MRSPASASRFLAASQCAARASTPWAVLYICLASVLAFALPPRAPQRPLVWGVAMALIPDADASNVAPHDLARHHESGADRLYAAAARGRTMEECRTCASPD